MASRSTPYENLSLHFFGDSGVLFDRERQRLFAVNASAAVVWSCLQDRLTPDQTAEFLIRNCQFDVANAHRTVALTIAQWSDVSNLDNRMAPRPSVGHVTRPSNDWIIATPNFCAEKWVSTYRLLDGTISVRYAASALQAYVDAEFAHLRAPDVVAADAVLDVVATGRGYVVRENDVWLERCQGADAIPVVIKICLIRKALERSVDFCALHAGVVRRDRTCLLLPGISGAGKSTLVAGMAARGYEIWADDTAVLTHSFAIRPVPFGIGLKSGSWKLLAEAHFPELMCAPTHVRPDGKTVRYLVPPMCTTPDPASMTDVRGIVFPHFEPTIKTRLSPIDKTEALQRLLLGFVKLGRKLDRRDVDSFLAWLDTVPCYALVSSSLDEACDLLEGLS